MVIPDESFWGMVGFGAALMGWMVTLERRLSRFMTFKEHASICDKRSDKLDERLEKIEGLMQKSSDQLVALSTNVAVINTVLSVNMQTPPMGKSS